MAEMDNLAACALSAPITDSLLLSSSVYASICGNGIRIATVAASTPIFVQGLGNSVQCLAYHHDKGLLAYCEGFSGLSPPRVFVLQFNDQLLSSANLACVGVLQTRAHDNSLVGLKFSHDGLHLIALSAIGSSSVIIWNVASASIVASADFEGLQSKIVVLPSPSVLKFATLGSCCADVWSVHTDVPTGDTGSITKQTVDVTRLEDGDYITCASWLSRYCLAAGLQSGKLFIIDVQEYVLRSRSATPQDVGSGICCLTSCTNHIIVGCNDGSIRFLHHEGTSAHTETVPFSSGYSVPAIGSSVLSMSPSQCMDSMLVACADGRLLAIVIPSDLLLSDKDGWAGELELADVNQAHTGPVVQVVAVGGEGAAVSIDPSGAMLVWSLLSGQCIASLNVFVSAPSAEEAATSLAVSGCGRLVAVGFRSGGFAVFDLSTLTNRKCVQWSRLDTTPVVAVAAHPIHPVFCVAFASNYVVFVSVTATAANIIGRTTTDVPIHSVHWMDSGSPGHVLVVLRDSSILRLTSPEHITPHSIHCTAPIETFDPRRVRLSAILAGLTGDVSVAACRCRGAVAEAGAGSSCMALSSSTKDFAIIFMPSFGNFEPESFSVSTFGKLSRRVSCLAISNDVENVALGCSDGSIAVASARDAIASYKFVRRHEGASLGCSSVSFVCDDLALLSSGLNCDVVCASLDQSTAGVRLLNLQQVLPPIDTKAESCCPAVKAVPFMPAFPPRSVFDVTANASGVDGAGSQSSGASREIHEGLVRVKQRLQQLLHDNSNGAEDEQLDRMDFIVDAGEFERMKQEGAVVLQNVRDSVKRQQLATDLLSERISEQTQRTMQTSAISVVGISSSHAVDNFPIVSIPPNSLKSLEIASFYRSVELAELDMQPAEFHGERKRMVLNKHMQEWLEAGSNPETEPDDQDDGTWPGDAGKSPEMYSHLELVSLEKRVLQCYLERGRIIEEKMKFNQELAVLKSLKMTVLSSIEEKQLRIHEINAELKNSQEASHKYVLQPSELGTQLDVHESEISAPRVAAGSSDGADDAANSSANPKARFSAISDEVMQRALEDMMGGTLTASKDSLSVDDLLQKPAFYGALDVQFTEEQLKACKEYERRLKLFTEQLEKTRSVLEAEQKKILNEIMDICDTFDRKVADFCEKRLVLEQQLLSRQLFLALVRLAVHLQVDSEETLTQLAFDRLKLLKKLESALQARDVFRVEYDAFRDKQEQHVLSERSLERNFLKHVLPQTMNVVYAGAYTPEQFKGFENAYKKRVLPPKEQQRKSQLKGSSGSGFALQIGDAIHEVPAMAQVWPLDLVEADMPDGDQEMFKLVSGARRAKIEAEMESKEQLAILLHLKSALSGYESAVNESEAALQKLDDSSETLRKLIEDLSWNSHLVLCLKQGAIEVPTFPDQTFDLRDAVLVQRNSIVDINRLVVTAGVENLSIMKATIGSSRDLYKLRWQESVADWKIDSIMEDTRYFQLLRVTKELQQLIKSGGKNKHQMEISTLERQIEHVKALHEVRIDEKKRKLFRGHRLIKEKELENDRLNEYVQDLAVSVAQRDKISGLGSTKDASEGDEQEFRLQELVWRRLVLEEARQQSEDVKILKAEVERLRQRTYPSFAKALSK